MKTATRSHIKQSTRGTTTKTSIYTSYKYTNRQTTRIIDTSMAKLSTLRSATSSASQQPTTEPLITLKSQKTTKLQQSTLSFGKI